MIGLAVILGVLCLLFLLVLILQNVKANQPKGEKADGKQPD